jgi:ferredoxin
MTTPELRIEKNRKSMFKDKVMALLPDGGNLNLCLTCGACSSGCPASGIEGMDPRKFLRLAAMGMDAEILSSQWAWCCTMCQRCIYACPMKIDIPQLIFNVRASWPRENRPKGIVASCDAALKHDTCSAMGVSEEDWHFVVEDVLEEVRDNQAGFEDLQAPMDKRGPNFFSTRIPGSRSPNPRKWCRCGKSCTWPGRTGPTAPRAGAGKTTACSWRKTSPGNRLCGSRPRPWRTWGAGSGSIPSEGTKCLQSGPD